MRHLLLLLALVAVPVRAQSDAPALTPAEQAVQATIQAEGVHVVHFWAPWCGNSVSELRAGLAEVIEAHPEVTFTFIASRNGVDDGAPVLRHYGIPERVVLFAQHDAATFLGREVSWLPTTWVFNRRGRLAYAFNYGEVSPALLTQALAGAESTWHH